LVSSITLIGDDKLKFSAALLVIFSFLHQFSNSSLVSKTEFFSLKKEVEDCGALLVFRKEFFEGPFFAQYIDEDSLLKRSKLTRDFTLLADWKGGHNIFKLLLKLLDASLFFWRLLLNLY